MEPISLSADALAQLQNLPERIAAFEKELARAKRAGLDVSAYEARVEQLKVLRTGMLREYGTTAQRRRS